MKKIFILGKWSFTSMFAVFGILHFGPLEYSIGYVPSFLPWPAVWVYFSGVCLIAFSLSAWLGKKDQLAAFLLAIMLLLFVILIHIPTAISGNFTGLIAIFRDLAMSGAALMYASAFAKDKVFSL